MARIGGLLAGQVALVTGASAGPGCAIAQALAQAGAAVGLCDTNPDRLERVAEDIRAGGGRVLPFTADISKRFAVSAMLEGLRDEFGGVNIVVNATLINRRADLLDLDEYDWQRVIAINLGGAFQCTQLAARIMADEGGGAVVNVVAGVAQHARPDSAAFAVSQAGLLGFTEVAAQALAPRGVRVNAVVIEDLESASGLTRAAQTVIALCAPDAQGVTGQTLVIDASQQDETQ